MAVWYADDRSVPVDAIGELITWKRVICRAPRSDKWRKLCQNFIVPGTERCSRHQPGQTGS